MEEGIVTKQRIDQYIVNDLYNDGIVLQDNTLRKVYEHYGRIAEILNDKDEIQRTFLFSEDKDEYQFAIDNLSNETYQYSPQWEKKLDMLTRFADNNIHNLQQVVADTLLALKLRIVEQQIAFLTNEMKSGNYNEEETIGLITHINQLNKCRKTIAEGLNRVISK